MCVRKIHKGKFVILALAVYLTLFITHAVAGDRLYGNEKEYNTDLCLTAYKIVFTSPFDQQKKHYELGSEFYPSLER